jgi:hypothetical protein
MILNDANLVEKGGSITSLFFLQRKHKENSNKKTGFK